MYDLPALRAATDAWWAGIARALAREGFAGVPDRLERAGPPEVVWRAPDLLLSQCCGRDLVTHLRGTVAPVAVPSYAAPGCGPGTYRSWLVARADDPRPELRAFAGAVAAVNYVGSHSGWVALAHALARAGMPEGCLERGILTGSHRASLAAVARGEADLAAVDCVSFALLARAEPELVAAVRAFATSEPAPALPYVTAAARPPAERDGLRRALAAAARDPAIAAARAAILLEGFVWPTDDTFHRTEAMAAEALRAPCARLEPWSDHGLRDG